MVAQHHSSPMSSLLLVLQVQQKNYELQALENKVVASSAREGQLQHQVLPQLYSSKDLASCHEKI